MLKKQVEGRQISIVKTHRLSDSVVVFSRDQCIASGSALHWQYAAAQPFPHIVVDDFIDAHVASELLSEWPDTSAMYFNKRNKQFGVGIRPADLKSPKLRSFLAEMNGEAMLCFVEKLTGISNLFPDPSYQDGGLHETKRGERIAIHADPSFHSGINLRRRVKLIIDLNQDWPVSYGGNLELWSRDRRECRVSVAPTLGGAVIFNTYLDSFYGVPDPVTCPPNRGRRSLSVYYYSVGEPRHDEKIAMIISEIMLDIFEDRSADTSATCRMDNINEWDLLDQLRLVSKLESQFKLRFTNAEVEGFVDISDVSRAILSKGALVDSLR